MGEKFYLRSIKTVALSIFFLLVLIFLLACVDEADCVDELKPNFNIAVGLNNKILKINGVGSWFVIFDNEENLKFEKCYKPHEFALEVEDRVNIVLNSTKRFKYSTNFNFPVEVELVDKVDDADGKEKIYLQQNKKYSFYAMAISFRTPIKSIVYDGETVQIIK